MKTKYTIKLDLPLMALNLFFVGWMWISAYQKKSVIDTVMFGMVFLMLGLITLHNKQEWRPIIQKERVRG